MVKSINNKVREIQNADGTLPYYAWPGGYNLFYVDAANNILCPACANKNDGYTEILAAYDINWEDDNLYCDDCSKQIPAAYND